MSLCLAMASNPLREPIIKKTGRVKEAQDDMHNAAF